MKISYYPTFEECVEAVKSEAVDCTYTYSITAQIYVIEDETNSIKATQLNARSFQFRMAVNADADMALYGLLNKAAHSQNSADMNELLNAYVLEAKRDYSLWNYFADHPFVSIAAISAVMLMADDEPSALAILGRAVLEAVPDAEIRSVSIAAEALEEIRDRGFRPDVAFLDIKMPGISGLEMAKDVRELSPRTNIVFVTAFSDYAMDLHRERHRAGGHRHGRGEDPDQRHGLHRDIFQ